MRSLRAHRRAAARFRRRLVPQDRPWPRRVEMPRKPLPPGIAFVAIIFAPTHGDLRSRSGIIRRHSPPSDDSWGVGFISKTGRGPAACGRAQSSMRRADRIIAQPSHSGRLAGSIRFAYLWDCFGGSLKHLLARFPRLHPRGRALLFQAVPQSSRSPRQR